MRHQSKVLFAAAIGLLLASASGATAATAALERAKTAATAKGNPNAPVGSTDFVPSPERPVGWRGDGTGRYPAATPPTVWSRKKSGSGYETKGILWTAALPNIGLSSPIVVGDRIFVTSEVTDLVCIDKKSGRILWIRSNPEFEGLPADERKGNPAFAEKLEPLAAQLDKANEAAVEALNSQRDASAALKKKRDLEKQISSEQQGIDKKRFERNGSQGLYGFSGPTPTSDGKRVYAFFTTGTAVAYDLDGKRAWIHHGAGGASEHGNFSSPVLGGNRLVVWAAAQMRGYDVDSGKVLWSVSCQDTNSYGSLFRLQSGGELVAGFQTGFFVRLSDGKAVWNKLALGGGGSSTPIVEGNSIIAYNDPGFRIFKIPSSTESGTLTASLVMKKDGGGGWGDSDFRDPKSTFNKNCIASPLFVDGLIYRLSEGGGLIVNDAVTGEAVYSKVLPMKSRTEYWSWGGASISPALAGKYIYLCDNQGTTVVIQPGRQYQEVAQNLIEESIDGKGQSQNLATPAFEGTRMYHRTPGFLYCIGDK